MDEILKKNLIKELGLDKLPAEKQEEVFAQIGTIVLEGVLTRVIPTLSAQERVEFEKIIAEGGEDNAPRVYAFLEQAVPNLDKLVNEEIAELKQTSFDVMSKIG
jgi:hypothetical protein